MYVRKGKFPNSKVVLDSSMGLSSKSWNIGTTMFTWVSLMTTRRCIWILWWWTTVGCSFFWTLGTKGHSMTFPFTSIFIHGNEHFKYLLVDLKYMGKEMLVMHCIERQRLTLSTNVDAIKAYNEMHLSYKIKVECSIGGLKHKLKRFMKIFDCIKPKSNHLL